jgi:hypothetical protein
MPPFLEASGGVTDLRNAILEAGDAMTRPENDAHLQDRVMA